MSVCKIAMVSDRVLSERFILRSSIIRIMLIFQCLSVCPERNNDEEINKWVLMPFSSAARKRRCDTTVFYDMF